MSIATQQQPSNPYQNGTALMQGNPFYQQQQAASAPTSPDTYQMPNFQSSMTYPQPMPPQATGYNPFFANSPTPQQQQLPYQQQQQHYPQQAQNLVLNTAQVQPVAANNPFARSPTRIASPTLGQIPEQSQTQFQSAMPFQTQQQNWSNPYFSAGPLQSPTQMGQYQPVQQQQQQYFQPQRADNASIMALYGQSQPAPQQQPMSSETAQPRQMPSFPDTTQPLQQQNSQLAQPPQQQQSFAQAQSPAVSKNPFMNMTSSPPPTQDQFTSNRSRESMALGMDLAWTNGRHSPDAFASLSARHV